MKFTIIDKKNIRIMKLTEVKRLMCLMGSSINVCYDSHVGFNVPMNNDFRMLLDCGNKIILDVMLSDERKQSGDKPFSPVDVFVKINEIAKRKNIYKKRSKYTSKIKFERNKIKAAYKKLLCGHKFSILDKLINNNYNTLGEFLALLHIHTIKEQIGNLRNVVINNILFQKSHDPNFHMKHDILFIQNSFDLSGLVFLIERFANVKKPRYIIIPTKYNSYFSVGDCHD